MKMLASDGKYALSADELLLINKHFVGYYTDEAQTKATVGEVFKNKNCLIDTHTAVAIHAAESYACDYKAERKILAVSTASPYKFASDVFLSVSGKEPQNELSALEELAELSGVEIPTPLCGLANKEIRHKGTINKDEMESATLEFARS